MSLKPTLYVALLTAFGAPVFGNDITHQVSSGLIAPGATGSVNAPSFDASLGVLRTTRVRVAGLVSGTWGVENTTAAPMGFGGGTVYVGAHVPVTLPAGGMPAPNPAFVPYTPMTLAPFDGTLDYAGPSGRTLTFTNEAGDGGPVHEVDLYTDAGLQAYAGTVPISIGLGPILPFTSSLPPGMQSTVTLSAHAQITVRYFYDPFPTRICRAQPWSGCPCNNDFGITGCVNSTGTQGGALDATGVASIGADTLVLTGTGMTNSSALYFQGTTFGYAQTVYGDGLRCVSGSVARLGTKSNAAGMSQYPVPGDLPISVRGAVTAPGPRYYQVVYRDGGNYCTASQFNATSGMAILWAP